MTTAPVTDFVPLTFDGTDWTTVEPYLNQLLEREVGSAEDFEKWLLDRSELEAAISESVANTYIDMTCDTGDEEKAGAWTSYLENVAPKLKPIGFALDQKFKALAEEFGMTTGRHDVLYRSTAADVELFRDENVPLETEVAKLDQEYDKVCGKMTVEFQGEEKTLPQMSKFFESSDRSVREDAWRTVSKRRLEDKDTIDGIYDKQVKLRDEIARNAGFDDFVGYIYKAKHRFDYDTSHAYAFHDAIEKHVMPFVEALDAKRREKLGLDKLRPWDLAVDPMNRDALEPFDGGVDLISRSHDAFSRLSPELGEMFATMGDGSNTNGTADGASLDLDSRKGKASGGYQYMRDRSRRPFIFMNAAGVHRDVETMVHEGGHAFHSMYCKDEPYVWYRHAPIEFAEVASMSMELLTMPYWDAFYPSKEDADRARRKQLEGSMTTLPWIATIDSFQHWVYQNPNHTRDERTAQWIEIEQRFGHMGHHCDWDGLEDERKYVWQKQGHLFGVPFYYIEYGIAQLGALGLWLMSLEQGEQAALDAYKRAMSLGGSKPLPELFEAAGLPFDFGAETVGRLVERVRSELEKLPE